jgi:hypothetical protein
LKRPKSLNFVKKKTPLWTSCAPSPFIIVNAQPVTPRRTRPTGMTRAARNHATCRDLQKSGRKSGIRQDTRAQQRTAHEKMTQDSAAASRWGDCSGKNQEHSTPRRSSRKAKNTHQAALEVSRRLMGPGGSPRRQRDPWERR